MTSPKTSPRVILGLMTYGPPSVSDARVTSVDEFRRHLDAFQSLGGTEIDTARIYMGGEQEKFTAEAGWRERGLSIATKSYPLPPGGPGSHNVRKDLETSLADLGTDSVDIFYLHHADRSTPFQETLAEVDKLYKEGKFKVLGLSNFAALEIAEVMLLCHHHGWVRPKIYQGVYNALNRNIETEIIPACHRYGLDVVVYNPLHGGLLTGKYSEDMEAPTEGRFSTEGFLGPIYRAMSLNDNNFRALKMITMVAFKHSIPMVEVAMRWLAHHSKLRMNDKGNDGVIVGISKIGQLKENIGALRSGPLPDDLVEVLENAWLVAKGTSLDPWHIPLAYTYDTEKAVFELSSAEFLAI